MATSSTVYIKTGVLGMVRKAPVKSRRLARGHYFLSVDTGDVVVTGLITAE